MVRVKDGIGDGFRNRVWVKVMIRGGLGGIHFSLSVLRLRLWPYWLLCPGIAKHKCTGSDRPSQFCFLLVLCHFSKSVRSSVPPFELLSVHIALRIFDQRFLPIGRISSRNAVPAHKHANWGSS